MRIYRGYRDANGPRVECTDGADVRVLSSARATGLTEGDVLRGALPGFEWGPGPGHGPGSLTLALAILLDLYPERGGAWAMDFRFAFRMEGVARLRRANPDDDRRPAWELTGKDIADLMRVLEGRRVPPSVFNREELPTQPARALPQDPDYIPARLALLEEDRKRALKRADDLTLDTQTCEEAVTALVSMVRVGRAAVSRCELEMAELRTLTTALRAVVACFKHEIEQSGAEHDDPDCPQDDTCACPNIKAINAAFSALHAIPGECS